ncbi:Transposon Ty3-I Gag-Pol polyprotein [Araneus ventricosus]|uniref:Transposon Ty3-I Gag-Pol polyprotein n=1 Tax=Araneus ventricosus TaxID=182803 RepID=A0A4Y2KIG4_ARAVE|nr:Transposon Ty3-I Gag-Pol polyprotein [Araneus ventricosus]
MPGVTKLKCLICSPTKNQTEFSALSVFESSTLIVFLPIRINQVNGIGCPDSGATRSVSGEALYKILQEQSMKFIQESISMTFVDGHSSNAQVLTTQVNVQIKNRVVRTKFIILPDSKDNRTLLGLDFLQDAGVGIALKSLKWYFSDNPHKSFPFENDVHIPPIHHMEVSSARKDILKAVINRLLNEGIIEPWESPYASPVVLVPKPNGNFRLCVDYRKLISVTKTDAYPLPRIDDLLQTAKHIQYMSTIDLKAGKHQVNVAVADRDKKAFTCPFVTYRFIRMSFELKNAPATFQRLITSRMTSKM